jgi:hypothetical protein
MLSSGANVIIWDEMLSSGMKCYHLELILSSGANVIIWDEMLSSGANVIMLQNGANVISWCYHVMLSSGMITPLFFNFFLKTSLTHLAAEKFSWDLANQKKVWKNGKVAVGHLLTILLFLFYGSVFSPYSKIFKYSSIYILICTTIFLMNLRMAYLCK